MAKHHRARRNSPLYMPSAFSLFGPSKDLFFKYSEVFATLYILPAIFWIHSWISTPAHGGNYWNRGTDANYAWPLPNSLNAAVIGFSILWFIFAVAVGLTAQIMSQIAQLDAIYDKRPTLSRSWKELKTIWKPMIFLYAAMAGLIVVSLGFFARRYILAPYILLEKKCSVKDALSKSHQLSQLNPGAIWGLIGVMLLIGLAGVLPYIGSLASFILGGLYSLAPAIRYKQLTKLT